MLHASPIAPALLALALAGATTGGDLEGRWSGKVQAPQGEAEIGFEFLARGGKLVAKLYMPLMHAYAVEVGPAEVDGVRVRVPVLDTELVLHGETLRGTFALGKLPVRLARGGEFPPEPPRPEHPEGPAPEWRRALGAELRAAPIVRDGVIHIGATDGRFHALRAENGETLWTWEGPHRIDGTAALDAEAVYFVDEANELVRLERKTGTEVWRVALHHAELAGERAPVNATFNHRAATPLIDAGTVLVGSSDGSFCAFEAATGKRTWRYAGRSPIYSGSAVTPDGRVAFGCMDGSLMLVDRRDGLKVDRLCTGGPLVTTPVLAAGRIVVGSRDYTLHGFDTTGRGLHWSYSYWFSWVESTPALAHGVLYVGSSDYRRVTALDPENGRALWSTDVRGLAWGTPLVTEAFVLVGTLAQRGTILHHEGALVALERKTGTVFWRNVATPPEGATEWGYVGSLAREGERWFAAGLDGSLAAYPLR